MPNAPNSGAPYLAEGQELAEVTHNEFLNIVDAIFRRGVKDKDLTTPPGSPVDGDAYIVPSGATGVWANHTNEITAYYSGWIYILPKEGMQLRLDDENCLTTYDGAAWQTVGTVASLAQDISPTYVEGEVQTISTRFDALLVELRKGGFIKP